MLLCNLKYEHSEQSIQILRNFINMLIRKKSTHDLIVQAFLEKFGKDFNSSTSVTTLTFNPETDKAFKEDLNDIIKSLVGYKPLDALQTIQSAINSAFGSLSNADMIVEDFIEPELSEGDQKQKLVNKSKLDLAVIEVMDSTFPSMTNLLVERFHSDLINLLFINTVTKEKYELNNLLINNRIADYKDLNFKKILNFLKSINPNDERLKGIFEMYKGKSFNLSGYNYVISEFSKYLKTQKDRGEKLYKLFLAKSELTEEYSKQNAYLELIQDALKNENFKEWFNDKYETSTQKERAKKLFLGSDFSQEYKLIKVKINEFIPNNKKISEKIKTIEGSQDTLLDIVNSFVILEYFDDLLNSDPTNSYSYDKEFGKNTHPKSKDSIKYNFKSSHSHQVAGFESFNKEDAISHTSANTKVILSLITLESYKDTHERIPQQLDMSVLSNSWQTLILDIINNNITSNEDKQNKLLYNVNTLQIDTVDKLRNILEILCEPDTSGTSLLTKLKDSSLLSDVQRSILYSFYTQVLSTNNKDSFFSLELDKINHGGSTKFLEITNDLCRVLYGNVSNNYMNVSIRHNKYEILKKFNWDSDVLNAVENINWNAVDVLTNTYYSDALDTYNFKTNSELLALTSINLKNKDGSNTVAFGFEYPFNDVNDSGIFDDTNRVRLFQEEAKDGNVIAQDNILNNVAKINLEKFKKHLVKQSGKTDDMSDSEYHLYQLLLLFLDKLKINFLDNIDVLLMFKAQYKADPNNNLHSANYLEHFLKLSLRILELENIAKQAKDSSYQEYTRSGNNKYNKFIDRITTNVDPYISVVNAKDGALNLYIKLYNLVTGKSIKSTVKNKSGSTMSNYSISRLGSELNRRIESQSKKSVAKQNLFYGEALKSVSLDPIIDSEITDNAGNVKQVKDLTSAELIQHAIFDKFYGWYINNDKFAFLLATYADKTTLLNYLTGIGVFGNGVSMNLMDDNRKLFIEKYRDTFFAQHGTILENVREKYETLLNFAREQLKNQNISEFISKRYNITNIPEEITNSVIKTYLTTHKLSDLLNLLDDYNKVNPDNKIELELDADYRIRNGKLQENEILEYYAELKDNDALLQAYITNLEKIFINHLKKYHIDLRVADNESELNAWVSSKTSYSKYNLLRLLSSEKILSIQDRKAYVNKWVNKSGELIIEKDGRLNPLFEKFFFMEGLASNNLRLLASGSEINHPDKAFDTLYNRIKKYISECKTVDNLLEDSEKITKLTELLIKSEVISPNDDIIEIIREVNKANTINDLRRSKIARSLYEKDIINIINTAQGTQYKRDVIIPATLHHPIVSINGIDEDCLVACIKDTKAPVNNLRESDLIDAQDGSAKISCIQMRLENNSLGEQSVGVNRKPIWDAQTDNLTTFLAKFAAFSDTNSKMLLSLKSNSSDFIMFKKMHNLLWNGDVDLRLNINSVKKNDFNASDVQMWFTEKILQNKKLFYKNKYGDIILIVGFGRSKNGDYYTKELHSNGTESKVYHYFENGTSNHLLEKTDNNHTINSLYELFVAMGGINCIDESGKTSDFSMDVLTNFVINVGHKTSKSKITNKSDVVQPLKKKFIAYAFNTSAVKNGAKNVNDSEAWTNPNKELRTFTLTTAGLGIQLNADHDVDDAQMTEFSQVIAACAAYGKSFRSMSLIYYSLGLAAFESARQELKLTLKYLSTLNLEEKEKVKYQLYTFIAKQILKKLSNSDLDISTNVKRLISQILQTKKDKAEKNDVLLAFSDPSIYNQFISEITSTINAKAIKRKHPGSQYVMVPGYNVIQMYHLWDGLKYRAYTANDIINRAKNEMKDLLKEALIINLFGKEEDVKAELKTNKKLSKKLIDKYSTERISLKSNGKSIRIYGLSLSDLVNECRYKTSIKNDYLNIISDDTTEFNSKLIDLYVRKRQEQETYKDKAWFMPTDIVNIYDANGKFLKSHNLDDMQDYYKFKNGIFDIEDKYNVTISNENDGTYIELNDPKIENEKLIFRLEKVGSEYHLHFKTGGFDELWLRRTKSSLTQVLKARLFNSALALLPENAILSIVPTELNSEGIGGLTLGSVAGFKSIGLHLDETFTQGMNPDELRNTSSIMLPIDQYVETQVYLTDDSGATIFDEFGKPLTKLERVQKYKKIASKDYQHLYKLNIESPYNLKPSLIRWLYYALDENGNRILKDNGKPLIKYMTIYDHPLIRDSWNKPKNERPTQKQILQVLDDLSNGHFILNGIIHDLVPDTFENTKAELVMGNMYQSLFGTGDSSIADILDKGSNYFKKDTEKVVPTIPRGSYDLAFIKDNGKHTLINIGEIRNLELDNNLTLNQFESEYVDSKGFIWTKPIQEEKDDDNNIVSEKSSGILIGRYVKADWVVKKETSGEKTKYFVYDENNNLLDPSEYKIVNDTTVEKKILFVDKYDKTITDEKSEKQITFYNISLPTPRKGLNGITKIQEALQNEYSGLRLKDESEALLDKILKTIYDDNNYIDIIFNSDNAKDPSYRKFIASSLHDIIPTKNEDGSIYTIEDINNLPAGKRHLAKMKLLLLSPDYTPEKYEYFKNKYYNSNFNLDKKWNSFVESLNFIASRIPAQSLLSFMPMECVAWTGDTGNTAYVSYIQTYLLGSDYDIDKAYIMGQSFDDNGVFIGWSPLFDYTNLQMSKKIPVPKNNKLKEYQKNKPELKLKYDITEQLANIINNTESNRIKNLIEVIYSIDDNGGNYWYDKTKFNNEQLLKIKTILAEIQEHENYQPKGKYAESAYKNIASSNIFNVVDDIRNRDLAYSPITMKDLLNLASNSPKGAETKLLNSINPLSKYIMQYQNMVGKAVIGIAANGEKVWFNLTYYYHKMLLQGTDRDKYMLKFSKTFNRIKNRSKGITEALPETIQFIPDLTNANLIIRRELKKLFTDKANEIDGLDDQYVDQKISQLLSAATDNAKELILSRINAGKNFAKYHLYLFMLGYSLDDVVSFMISPAIEMIDKYSEADCYQSDIRTLQNAINMLQGKFSIESMYIPEDETKGMSIEEKIQYLQDREEAIAEALADAAENGAAFEYSELTPIKNKLGDIYHRAHAKNVNDFFQKYFNYKLGIDLKGVEFIENEVLPITDNYNINYIFKFVDNLISDIQSQIKLYNIQFSLNYGVNDFFKDLSEFLTLSKEANDMSVMASTWLKLNQGIPLTDVDIIKMLRSMQNTVSQNEKQFGIHVFKEDFDEEIKKMLQFDSENSEDIEETKDKTETEKTAKKTFLQLLEEIINTGSTKGSAQTIISKILNNNPLLDVKDSAMILRDAVVAGLYGKFDINKYLDNQSVIVLPGVKYNTGKLSKDGKTQTVKYRDLAANYFNLIKSSWNILHMMNSIEHYEKNIDLLGYTMNSRKVLSRKSRVIQDLVRLGGYYNKSLDDKVYKNLTKYADDLLILSFALKLEPIPLESQIISIEETDGYDHNFKKITLQDSINLNTLNGLASFKYFMEHDFITILKKKFPENDLVKEVMLAVNHNKSIIRTFMDLLEHNLTLANKLKYNKYLVGMNELMNTNFDSKGTYKFGELLFLYSLLNNGTKVGGKYLTGLFINSAKDGSLINKWYSETGTSDYNSIQEILYLRKLDLLIACAPTVHSKYAVELQKAPIVKYIDRTNMVHFFSGKYDRKKKKYIYNEVPLKFLKGMELGSTRDERIARELNFLINSPFFFPKLHLDLLLGQFLTKGSNLNINIDLINTWIRENKLLIYKDNCD